MKKWVAVLLMLVLALSLTGCQTDPAKEAAKVVAEVNGAKITKGEAESIYNQMMTETEYYYSMYGYSFDRADKTVIASIKSQTLTLMTENLALEQKAEALGLALTEEEEAAVEQDAQDQYNELISGMMEQYELTEEDAVAQAAEAGTTLAMIQYFLRNDKIQQKLHDYAGQDAAVTDEEITAEFDTRVAKAKENYDATPSQYSTDVLNGSTIYYRPAGYRNIKNLVISLPEDVQTTVDDLSSQLYMATYYKYMYDYQLTNGGELDDATKQEYTDKSAEYQTQIDDLQVQLDAAAAAGREQIQAKADEVLALCKAEGADFDALMAEYNGDTATGTLVEVGYPVCADSTGYVEAFTQGAMALEKVGDVSDLIATSYGYHILQYASDVTEGAVELDDALRAANRESVQHVKRERRNHADDGRVKCQRDTVCQIGVGCGVHQIHARQAQRKAHERAQNAQRRAEARHQIGQPRAPRLIDHRLFVDVIRHVARLRVFAHSADGREIAVPDGLQPLAQEFHILPDGPRQLRVRALLQQLRRPLQRRSAL